MPSRAICSAALVISAFMNDIHWSSTHIGSSPRVAGKSGRHVHPFVPARSVTIFPPSVAGQSMMVAFAEMERGAAFIASAILGALVSFACATARSGDPGETNASTRRARARCIRSSMKRVFCWRTTVVEWAPRLSSQMLDSQLGYRAFLLRQALPNWFPLIVCTITRQTRDHRGSYRDYGDAEE